MSDSCDITGMSSELSSELPDLHSLLVDKMELSVPSNEILTGFAKPLQNTVSNNGVNKGETKRRTSLMNHLEKTIASKFKGSKLTSFGSSETGLSLKGGDLDLCLQMQTKDQKAVIKKIGNLLRRQGMEKVHVLSRATVPIVKFNDPRSGIEVDISINNSLALHNTKLLRTYSELDERVKELALCVKYWARHRHLSDAPNGTLSSYAWSILTIYHLQSEGVIPNLQSGEERTIAEVDGHEYDLTIGDQQALQSEKSLPELLYSFFHRFATWNWEEDIVSIRTASTLSRKDKGWENEEPSALEVVTSDSDKIGRMGEHHLAIEDPFNTEHDLSRVVRAMGELRIRNELIRAARMIGEGATWKAICETVNPERLEHIEPEDLFFDLRDKSDHDVKNMREKVAAEMDALDKRIEALEAERLSNIKMARAMRGVIEETSDLRKEHKNVIVGLRERNKEIESLKESRDNINANIIIPLHVIEEELSKVYLRLTEEMDLHRVPSLEREKSLFSLFLELQAMHGKAREASENHQRFLELVKEQKEQIKQLKIFETKHDEATTKLLADEPLLKDKDISSNEVRSHDRRVQNIQKALRQRRGEIHRLRREAGRLDAWLRKKSGAGVRRPSHRDNRKGGKKGKRGRKEDASAPMTLGDISGLLSGMSSDSSSKKTKKVSSKKAGMRKLGNLGAHRGSRGKFQRKD